MSTDPILGDPTLRALHTSAVTNLVAAKSGSTVTLTWASSATPGATYHVYRATSALSDSWTRLTTTPLTTPGFTNSSLANGTYHYLVKALALETTPVGSYTNLSVGARTQISIP